MSASHRSTAVSTASLLFLAGFFPTIVHGADSIPAPASTPTRNEVARLRVEHFTEVRDANALPDSCKRAFTKLTGEPNFSLADPERSYQANDIATPGARLPWRRLVFGRFSSDRCVI